MLKLIFLSKILDDCANLGFFSHHLNHREVFKSVFYRDYQDNPQGHVWKKTGWKPLSIGFKQCVICFIDENICFRDINLNENHSLSVRLPGYQEIQVLKGKIKGGKDSIKIMNVEFIYKQWKKSANKFSSFTRWFKFGTHGNTENSIEMCLCRLVICYLTVNTNNYT